MRERDRDRGQTVLQRGDGMTQTLNYSTYSQILKFKSFFASSQLLERVLSLLAAFFFPSQMKSRKFNRAYRREKKKTEREKGGKNTGNTNKTPVKSVPNICPVISDPLPLPYLTYLTPTFLQHIQSLSNSRQDNNPRNTHLQQKRAGRQSLPQRAHRRSIDVCIRIPACAPPHFHQGSPTSAEPRLFSGMSHKHKGPSSAASETINLGLMSDAGEAAAFKRAINNSPACVYTPSLTTRAEKTRPCSFQV